MRVAALIGVLAFLPAVCFAEEQADLAQVIGLSGSIRGAYWSSSRSLDDVKDPGVSALWMKVQPKLGSETSALVEGRVNNQNLAGNGTTEGVLREAYVDHAIGSVDLRIGKQIIVWGRADRINPTDNLTPRDYTLMVPDDDDQRLGVPAIKSAYHFESFTLSGIWLADFKPNTVPIRRSIQAFTFQERDPREGFKQWAFKLDQSGKAVDWSISYFDGFDISPDIGINRFGTVTDLSLNHNRLHVVGADAATTLGRYGLRAEASYTLTSNPNGENPMIKKPFFYFVLGIERTFLEYLNINLQYFGREVFHYSNPRYITDITRRTVALQQAIFSNQLFPYQQGVTVRISNKWLNETLEAEVAGIVNATTRDYALRPKVSYNFTDHWKGTVGADLFRGPEETFYGRLRDISTEFAELRYSF